MRILIEEYQYTLADEKRQHDLKCILKELGGFENVEGKISVNNVGYYYSAELKDCVFILPKVLITVGENNRELAFGEHRLEDIINIDQDSPLSEGQRRFIYEFAVWIYRVIDVYRTNLLVKNFNIVFEAIIDELIGETGEVPAGLKKQEDGKMVDHIYTYQGLTTHEEDKPIYYIGDSKYYKRNNPIGTEAVAKQFTYARNVIQWNLNLFMKGDPEDEDWKNDWNQFREVPKLRDDVTEGYNIIPNFYG